MRFRLAKKYLKDKVKENVLILIFSKCAFKMAFGIVIIDLNPSY